MSRRLREHHFQSAVTDSIRTYRGTPYACNERDINLATWDFSDDNIRPYVSASEANRELVQHNDERRLNPPHERDAIRRLTYAMAEAKAGYWGPDLMIKCFLDFDVMFFGGVLRGNCHVDWIDFNDPYWPLDQAVRGNNLGITNLGITRYLRTGRALIWLNARGIFLSPIIANPFKAAFFTLLHEMCVRITYLHFSALDCVD